MDIQLKLFKKEMMFDVMNDTHIVGRSRAAQGAPPETAFGLQADSSEAHTSKLLRSMQVAIETAKQKLASFLKGNSGVDADNILMDSEGEPIVITLSVSDRFNKAFIPTITGMMHKYVVNIMLYDWFNANDPSLAEKYLLLATAAIDSMQKSFIKLPPSRPVHEQ